MTQKGRTTPHQRNEKTAKAIRAMLADGLKINDVKRYTGLSVNTLKKHYKKEFEAANLKPGKPEHKPNGRTRMLVKFMKLNGETNEKIAKALDISNSTLTTHYVEELDTGGQSLNAEIAAGLAKNALNGDKIAQIVWLKMFAGKYEAKAPNDNAGAADDMAAALAKLAEGLPGG
jgi:hypothetical protein